MLVQHVGRGGEWDRSRRGRNHKGRKPKRSWVSLQCAR